MTTIDILSAVIDNLYHAGWSLRALRDLADHMGGADVQIGNCGVDGANWNETMYPGACIEPSARP